MCPKHRVPRRPLPAGDPPPPSIEVSLSNQTTVVATRNPSAGVLCVGSLKADGEENDMGLKIPVGYVIRCPLNTVVVEGAVDDTRRFSK